MYAALTGAAGDRRGRKFDHSVKEGDEKHHNHVKMNAPAPAPAPAPANTISLVYVAAAAAAAGGTARTTRCKGHTKSNRVCKKRGHYCVPGVSGNYCIIHLPKVLPGAVLSDDDSEYDDMPDLEPISPTMLMPQTAFNVYIDNYDGGGDTDTDSDMPELELVPDWPTARVPAFPRALSNCLSL